TPQYAACNQSEHHCPERGNETERGIAAAVVRKSPFTPKKIEPPRIERPGEVAVLLPMRGESVQPVLLQPRRRHSNARIVKVRSRQRIQRECQPITGDNHPKSNPLPSHCAK